MSWIPFYWLGKCFGLALLFLPDGNIPTVIFERFVVWGMDHAHDVLNNLVVPNVVQFVVFLPWRFLLVLFPTLPPPDSSYSRDSAGSAAKFRRKGNNGGRLSSRLQHLKIPKTPATDAADGEPRRRRSPRTRGEQERSQSPPRLAPRTPAGTARGDGEKHTGSAKATGTDISLDREGRNSDLSDAPASGIPGSPLVAGGDALAAVGVPCTPASGEKDSSPERGSGRSGRRRSIGEIVRSAITGNSKVRLRDHLFDLNTASPAPPQAETQEPKPSQADDRSPSTGRNEAVKPKSDPKVDLPAILTDSPGPKSRRANTPVTNGNGATGSSEASAPEPAVRPTNRRRPSEFSQNVPAGAGGEGGGGGGGGDGAGGGLGDGPSRGVRRRSGSGRRAPASEKSNGPATSVKGGVGSTAKSASSAPSAGDTAEMRAKRLAEWRRRRAEQAQAQQLREVRPRRSRIAGADATPGPGSIAATSASQGSSDGRSSSGGGGGRANPSASRRFRHVERFRSEMAGVAGPPVEAKDIDPRTQISGPSTRAATANGRPK